MAGMITRADLDDCAACREFVAIHESILGAARKALQRERATAETPEKLVQRILASLEG